MCVCARACYHVDVCGALREDGADGGGQAQFHQALQLRPSVRLRVVPRLLQSAAVYHSKAPAQTNKQKKHGQFGNKHETTSV